MSRSRDQYLSDLWDQTLNDLIANQKVEPEIINAFYRTAHLAELNDTKAIIVVANIIAQQIVSQSSELIGSALIEQLNLDHPLNVEIVQESDFQRHSQVTEDDIAEVTNDEEFASMPIQPDRTFDNFVVGDCNRESQAAALACAYNPGKYFNPLFIYGNSGLGKTHLLMAIGNYVKKNYPDKKVYYIESLKFVDKVVKAIQNNKIDAFKQYMSSMDVLLVDDIQFLAGKEKSHEVFFSIYNELVNNRKQICIASDRQPKEIKGLEDRLISRFSSGLSVGIDSPEFETSLAILNMKIKNSGNNIEEVDERGLAYIASNFSGNVRDLEGAWNRVLFYAIMFQEDKSCIKFETVVNALKNQAVVSDKTGLSPGKIIKAVADYYGLTRQQITGKTRTKNISNARHISIYLCRKLLDLSYIKIGEEFGGRDHSTVISACTKVEKQIRKDTAMATAVEEIRKQLGS
ncbi:chromosomal replication initiator protein DnaA [Erysipelotrichaceae bacterium Oil+RF-744-GAM-WT-6]|jgi:chromosomal replication initiator protein|uniref:Chromosomal replication initiator protein DnaA n=1 Tax=Stecheria intestinalis TaxID=2606630 RepID=A0A7X2TGG0_9FIRM|nr:MULTISPECIES: chromosomal replication initiator protein DnaA [Erysipelotrichaceae]MDY3233121.1 chromosomal replication initiator protein DnaA [Erysipelotrichaceae bacterium]MDY4682162.1 chromosomal replication initiator protein DnaA [Lachnospiraceae bacterium]MCI6746942.1 chromosomal replication initiator protein DnaA [Anaerolactibacter massiliensis]MDD5881754.1 chromosomal replication initiator protein DnaA [Stecheria intestinalis]MDD6365700.1 chromosomal replication initiator protein DnaA